MEQDASKFYDLIIIGAGPGGFTAGMYGARADLKTLLIEATATLSQISYADYVENYPGFPEGISGYDLNDRFRNQAKRFGLETVYGDVTAIDTATLNRPSGRRTVKIEGWEVRTGDATYQAPACIIATGASWRRLGIPGEDTLVGKGVSYCATCDAPFYRGKDIAVVGGGDTAVGEAIYLTKFARKVTIVHRRDKLRAVGLLQKRAFENGKIDFIWNSVPESILGEDQVAGIRLRNKISGEVQDVPVQGVFPLIGLNPNTHVVRGAVKLDENGYILVDENMATSAKGIFACGDCIHKSLRQVVTACGDGAVAAFAAQDYIGELKGAL